MLISRATKLKYGLGEANPITAVNTSNAPLASSRSITPEELAIQNSPEKMISQMKIIAASGVDTATIKMYLTGMAIKYPDIYNRYISETTTLPASSPQGALTSSPKSFSTGLLLIIGGGLLLVGFALSKR